MNPRIISSVDDLTPLLSLIRAAARCLEPSELLDFTLRGFLASRPHIRRAEVRLLEGERLACAAVVSDSGSKSGVAEPWGELDGRPLDLDHALLGPVVRHGECRWARDENGWGERPEWAVQNGVLSYYAAPLIDSERCLGLFVSWRTARYNSDVLHGRAKLWKEAIAGLLAARLPATRHYAARGRQIGELERLCAHLRSELVTIIGADRILAEDTEARTVLRQIDLVAEAPTPVLFSGEPGTGKTLHARALHEAGAGERRPFLHLRAGDPELGRLLHELVEPGNTEIACLVGAPDGATLYVEHVDRMDSDNQSRLLRVIEQRLGEARGHRTLRVVASTREELGSLVVAGRFREDLFYRLSAFPIALMPLRDRTRAIPTLARRVLERICARESRPLFVLNQTHIDRLQAWPWPGNMRELIHVLERSVLRTAGGPLQLDLPQPGRDAVPDRVLTAAELKALEVENVRRAMEECGWKIAGDDGAAERLGLKPSTLSSKLSALKIHKPNRVIVRRSSRRRPSSASSPSPQSLEDAPQSLEDAPQSLEDDTDSSP